MGNNSFCNGNGKFSAFFKIFCRKQHFFIFPQAFGIFMVNLTVTYGTDLHKISGTSQMTGVLLLKEEENRKKEKHTLTSNKENINSEIVFKIWLI